MGLEHLGVYWIETSTRDNHTTIITIKFLTRMTKTAAEMMPNARMQRLTSMEHVIYLHIRRTLTQALVRYPTARPLDVYKQFLNPLRSY
jgi:hypothetical protein